MTDGLFLAFVVGGMLAASFVFALVFAIRFTRVGPDEALIITGLKQQNGERFRVVIAGGTFVWPVLEMARRLSLAPIPVQAGNGRRLADGFVRIKPDRKAVAKAAERFVSMSPQDLGRAVSQIVESALNADAPAAAAAEALEPMGLEIVSLSVKDRA
ncbi:MAG TPA: hypothetical protein VF950_11910 [Planctomycetota bacterium]